VLSAFSNQRSYIFTPISIGITTHPSLISKIDKNITFQTMACHKKKTVSMLSAIMLMRALFPLYHCANYANCLPNACVHVQSSTPYMSYCCKKHINGFRLSTKLTKSYYETSKIAANRQRTRMFRS